MANLDMGGPLIFMALLGFAHLLVSAPSWCSESAILVQLLRLFWLSGCVPTKAGASCVWRCWALHTC